MPARKPADVRPVPVIDLGQKLAETFLDRLGRDRTPALLFTGPEGSGRELTALEFARKLTCRRDAPCQMESGDVCDSCLKASLLEHPGIHIVYPTPTQGTGEGADGDITDIARVLDEKRTDIFARYRFSKKASIRIARARATIQRAASKPFESTHDVFIFNDAHAMREEAQNALLKLVEEPPPHVVLIFITSNPDGVLYTIRSRCQHVRFQPLGAVVVEEVLTGYYGTDKKTARRAAAMSQGSINRARERAEALDDTDRDAAAAFVAGLTKEGETFAVGQAMAIGKGANRDGVARFLDEVTLIFRDMMSGDTDLHVNRDLSKELHSMSRHWERRRLPGVIDRIARTRGDILIYNAAIDAALAECFMEIARARAA